MLIRLGKITDENSENFNKELKKKSELNTITEMKNTVERNNSRLGDTEEHVLSGMEDKIIEVIQSEQQQKEKQIFKNGKSLRDL